MALSLRRRPKAPVDSTELVVKAIKVAQTPGVLMELRPEERQRVDQLAKAMSMGASWTRPGSQSGTVAHLARARPVSAEALAARAHAALGPSSNLTPLDIEVAMRNQGIDWVEPFAPGKPLTPYYGYNRRPRERNYEVGRNIGTQTRPGRIPFETLKHLSESYDVATICMRHAISDLRSMRLRFEPMDGYEENPVKEIEAAKTFLRRPDRSIDENGKPVPGSGLSFRNWLCKHASDVWRYDAGTMYRRRDRSGRLITLPVPDGTLFAPMLDYFGAEPYGDAPAYEQFIQGIPWDWLSASDLIYEPMWPHPEDPYGVAPIETILVNANTDMRLQTYFLQFFTTGQVPEAFATAPEDQSDPDALADWQEEWNGWTYGDQSERWGLRWLPHGTELEFYKPQQFDPDVAEYVMRRTVAAFMMVPHDLGFTDDVNRASGDTQMDVQFRISSLPNVAYYEDMLDAILQEDLSLPVQVRFDTGREKEDRLMEAQAHQIYVSIGAESPDEVRSKVLGYAVDPTEKVPRLFDSNRLGPIPISELLATSGDVDPLTGAPRPGTVQRRPFAYPGTPVPGQGVDGGQGQTQGPTGTQYDDNAASDRAKGKPAPRGGAGPKVGSQTKVYPKPVPRQQPSALPSASKPVQTNAPNPRRSAGVSGARAKSANDRAGAGGRQRTGSQRSLKEATAGISTATGIAGVHGAGEDSDSDDEDFAAKDLWRWQRQSRARVDRGQEPRHFLDSAIAKSTYDRVWYSLCAAETREQVDQAFSKAYLTEAEVAASARDEAREHRPFAGLALRAADTGRVLMVQRAHMEGDPAAGTFEFPGGHIDEGESTRDGAEREFEEETGCRLPDTVQPIAEWDSTNGVYRGHVYEVPNETDIDLHNRDEVVDPDNPDQDYFEAIVWMDPAHLSNNPAIRNELRADCHLAQHAIKPNDARKSTPKVAGIALVAADTGRVLMVQRANKHG